MCIACDFGAQGGTPDFKCRTGMVIEGQKTKPKKIHESSDCFEYPEESLFKSGHPRKYLPNFPTPLKNPGIKNFEPKKSFNHPCHLKPGAPPLGFEEPARRLECTPIVIMVHKTSRGVYFSL